MQNAIENCKHRRTYIKRFCKQRHRKRTLAHMKQQQKKKRNQGKKLVEMQGGVGGR
jgi:hypothetical protein